MLGVDHFSKYTYVYRLSRNFLPDSTNTILLLHMVVGIRRRMVRREDSHMGVDGDDDRVLRSQDHVRVRVRVLYYHQ